MSFKRTALAAGVLLTLSACAHRGAPVDYAPRAQGPAAPLQRNVTHFSEGLRCMDDMLFRFGVRDVSMMVEELQDNTRRLGAGTRDMMVSAVSDMTRRSRAVKLVTFGQDNQNVVNLINFAQRTGQFKAVPQFDVRGSITQFDEDLLRKEASVGASLVSLLTGPIFGARFGRTSSASVVGFDASVITTADLSLVPGVSSKNVAVVKREQTSAGDGQAVVKSTNLSFSFSTSANEGISQAIRNMVELASIELVGKLLRMPYWGCLKLPLDSPEVAREMSDWFDAMSDSGDLHRFLQEQLRNRKFYDGPADGKPNDAYREALATYRAAIGVPGTADPDFATFRAFLLSPVPRAPERPSKFAPPKATPPAPPGPQGASAPAVPALSEPGKPIKLSVVSTRQSYRKGEPIEMVITTDRPGYVYCYVQSPSNGKIQRIFPNRFQRDPRIEANTPLALPGGQGFAVAAGGEGARKQIVGCLATEREVYNELQAQLRWGDFEDIRLGTFEEIRNAFVAAARADVPVEGVFIDVVDR